MDGHQALSVVTCVGHVAFVILLWTRRDKSSIGTLLLLLFLDAFAWNFADLARSLTGSAIWHRVDRLFSSFMPILAFHVVATFVGATRSLKRTLQAGYGVTLAIAAGAVFTGTSMLWWKAMVAAAVATLASSTLLLVRHRRTTTDPEERARCDLIALAVGTGSVLGVTDLLHDELPFFVPRLANVGTLAALALITVAVLRLRLLGRALPKALPVYSVFAGSLAVTGYLGVVRYARPDAAFLILAGLTLALVCFALVRELGRTRAVERERTLKLAALGRFSEQLAHDLKNPLAALKGSLQFLEVERREGRSLDAQTEYLGLMLGQVERMNQVVSHYQRLSRVEPSLESVDVNKLVEKVIVEQRLAATEGVAIEAELASVVPPCPLDRDLISIVLENILRNAFEAMPAGGTVRVRTERVAGPADSVRISVEDRGSGMDARALERATDEFFTTKAQGSGLGLNFAARVARAHGGELSIQSVLGRGTTVRLSLPIPDVTGS